MYSHERPAVSAYYSEDYDITHLHSLVRAALAKESDKLQSYSKELRLIKEKLSQPQTVGTQAVLRKRQAALVSYIEDVRSERKLKEYLSASSSLVEEYRAINAKTSNGGRRKVLFGLTDIEQRSDLSREDKERRFDLIELYLRVAESYADFAISRQFSQIPDCCVNCGNSLSESVITIEGLTTCSYCCAQQDLPLSVKGAHSDRTLPSSETSDDSIENFLRAFYRYQGVQSTSQSVSKIDPSVYESLDKYFRGIGAPTGEEVKKLPLNSKGRRGSTNHAMIWDALSCTGYEEYYEHTNLIGHRYFGWELPNVMSLRDLVVSDYNKTQAVLKKLPHKERSSSLGVQYRLWRHLQLRGHPCSMDEFKIPQHPDSFHNNDQLWRLMCQHAGDPDIYYIEPC